MCPATLRMHRDDVQIPDHVNLIYHDSYSNDARVYDWTVLCRFFKTGEQFETWIVGRCSQNFETALEEQIIKWEDWNREEYAYKFRKKGERYFTNWINAPGDDLCLDDPDYIPPGNKKK